MTTSLHISLPDSLKEKVKYRVEKSHYSNPTDYVRSLIRKDILKEQAREQFEQFIRDGLSSPVSEQTPKEMISELKKALKK